MLRIAVLPLFVSMFCSTLCADHHQEAARLMEYYGWWDGTWEVTIKDGETSTMTVTRPKANAHLVDDASFGVSLWGYDPKKKRWVGTAIQVDGSFSTTTLEPPKGRRIKPGTADRATTITKHADGTVTRSKELWTYIDANTATNVITATDKDGNKTVTEYKFVRKPKSD